MVKKSEITMPFTQLTLFRPNMTTKDFYKTASKIKDDLEKHLCDLKKVTLEGSMLGLDTKEIAKLAMGVERAIQEATSAKRRYR